MLLPTRVAGDLEVAQRRRGLVEHDAAAVVAGVGDVREEAAAAALDAETVDDAGVVDGAEELQRGSNAEPAMTVGVLTRSRVT